MEVRITKLRVAMAALFVRGRSRSCQPAQPTRRTPRSPTVGQVVNISDHSASAYFAKVTSAGELKTNGVVSGKVSPALPPACCAETACKWRRLVSERRARGSCR